MSNAPSVQGDEGDLDDDDDLEDDVDDAVAGAGADEDDDADEDEDLDDLDASGDADDFDDDEQDGPAPTAVTVLTYVVRSLVEAPDAVRVEIGEGRRGIDLSVRVGPDDMGRVIGKRGRTANAIRTVVRAAASRDGVEVDVDFVD